VKLSHMLLIAALVPATLVAQSPDSLTQQGRTLISVSLGLAGTRRAVAAPGSLSAAATGQLASLAFTHFVQPSVAIDISASALAESDYVVGGHAHHEGVTPLLFGLHLSPAAWALGSELRPFVSLAGGPYIRGISDASAFGGASATTQSVIGARTGVGANWYVARHFALQLEGDYHLVPAFDAIAGAKQNVSGASLSVGLGFAWGGRAR
jgi:hypothetical protein